MSAMDKCDCGGFKHQHALSPEHPTCSHCPPTRKGSPGVCIYRGPEMARFS